MENKSFGQISYEAYANFSNYKSLATGSPIPTWNLLKDEIREAWEVAGQTLITYYEDYLLNEFMNKYRGNDDSN